MRRRQILAAAAAAGVLLAGCGDGDGTADETDATVESTEQVTPDAADETEAASEAPTGDDGADDEPDTDDGATAAGAATVTIEGETYEAVDPIECRIGAEGAPEDREFLGTSADGTVQISISWFADEALQGLSGLDVVIDGAGASGGELTWSSLFATEKSFEITTRSDGADGTATVGSLNLVLNTEEGEIANTPATWSFTC